MNNGIYDQNTRNKERLRAIKVNNTEYGDNNRNAGDENTSVDEHGDTANSDSGKDITSKENKWN